MSENPAVPDKLHFPLIDPLRGFAAVTVLVYHAIAHFDWQNFPARSIYLWFHWGWMGVDIFFIISGFVITLSALQMQCKYSGLPFIKAFLKRRFLRIAPLYYLTLLLFIFMYISWNDLSSGNLISHLLFLHPWSFVHFGAINGPNWSVGTEMQFYIFLALIIPFINYQNVIKVTVCLLLAAWAWRFGAYTIYGNQPDQVFVLFTKTVLLPGALDEFGLGILLAFFVNSGKFDSYARSWIFKLAAAAACAVTIFITIHIYSLMGVYWDNVFMVVLFRSLLGLIFSLVILLLCTLRPANYILWLLRPAIYLGTISYGIYLFHLPVMLKVKELDLANHEKLFLTFAITLILASMSWHFFEKRFLKK